MFAKGFSSGIGLRKQAMSSKRFLTSAKSVIYSSYGEPSEVIRVHSYTIPDAVEKQVVVKCLGFPINPSDINQLEGVYPSRPEFSLKYQTGDEPSAIAGNEGLFEVVEVGPEVSKFKKGDRVVTIHSNFGTWTSHNVANEEDLIFIPNDLTVEQGGTISVNPCTAYQLVNNYGVEAGDWIIQNAGTSAVSQLVAQIAKAKGINVISVIRDRPNLQETVDKLTKLGATKVLTEDENADRSIAGEIKKLTNGKLKLALNSVGGKSGSNIARKLANDATFITYGGMSKQPVTLPTSLFIFKNLKSIGYWVTANAKKDPQNKVDTVEAIIDLYQQKKLVNFSVTKKVWKFDEMSNEQVLELVKAAIRDSSKGKQFISIE